MDENSILEIRLRRPLDNNHSIFIRDSDTCDLELNGNELNLPCDTVDGRFIVKDLFKHLDSDDINLKFDNMISPRISLDAINLEIFDPQGELMIRLIITTRMNKLIPFKDTESSLLSTTEGDKFEMNISIFPEAAIFPWREFDTILEFPKSYKFFVK